MLLRSYSFKHCNILIPLTIFSSVTIYIYYKYYLTCVCLTVHLNKFILKLELKISNNFYG